MTFSKPIVRASLLAVALLTLFVVYRYLNYFGDVKILGGILGLEVVLACVWNYSERFLLLLMIAFLWAGLHLPLQAIWGSGRWAVLAMGAGIGCILWTRSPLKPSGWFHWMAFSCVGSAFVSSTVSIYFQLAFLKTLSLFLLFLYCATGARLAVVGREDRFFRGVQWAGELLVYFSAIAYLGGAAVWGNPNSLGAAMSIVVFPILLWGWLTSDSPALKFRRLVALLLCAYLIRLSLARAAMVAVAVVIAVICVCLRQYKVLTKVCALGLLSVALAGMFAPDALFRQYDELKDALLYKGHKEEGFMGSRKSPWDKSISVIKEHPFFGTGYGMSPSGEDMGSSSEGAVRSSGETAREHGSSYMEITEWVGMCGALPFVVLLGFSLRNVWKVCLWMYRTGDPRHYSIPIAMVVLAGTVHASFEDWLFAPGSYLCLFFWFSAFALADFLPVAFKIACAPVVRSSGPAPAALGAVAPNRIA